MQRQPRHLFSAILLVFATHLCFAQQAEPAQQRMDNDAVLKLSSSGLSENLIVQTINATPGHYDTSTDGLIALKKAGLTDREVAAMLLKNANPNTVFYSSATPGAVPTADGTSNAVATPALDPNAKPRIFLQSESHGTSLKSRRDQSMEMSKDFEKNCPAVRITINQTLAAYTIMLNHVEGDFSRTNQLQIADKNGDLISKTRQGGTISGDVKRACAIILADWTKNFAPPPPPAPGYRALALGLFPPGVAMRPCTNPRFVAAASRYHPSTTVLI